MRSNVRAFRERSFTLWRCRDCSSLHARDAVDLGEYYATYPFHALPDDARLRATYACQLRRLRRAAVRRQHAILDYGCGAGHLVRYLRARGFARAAGYDAHAAGFSECSRLEPRYDCVIAQDVLEHVESPAELLAALGGLTKPGGVIVIGTPSADAIDLRQPERHVHTLHAPYHRHILSRQALVALATERGWRLERYYRTHYSNTLVPCLNSRFYLHYMGLLDDTLDALFEPPRALPLLRRLPSSAFWGLFGYFFAPATDITAVFRVPSCCSNSR